MRTLPCAALAAALALLSSHASAHGTAAPGMPAHGKKMMSMDHSMHMMPEFGKVSAASSAARIIEVDMADTMRFAPAVIEVEKGTPLRFVVKNSGRVMHELVLGTAESLADHKEMMEESPGMDHGGGWMAHVPPGQQRELGWTFTEAGEFLYGCLIPGHFEAGMVGRVIVR